MQAAVYGILIVGEKLTAVILEILKDPVSRVPFFPKPEIYKKYTGIIVICICGKSENFFPVFWDSRLNSSGEYMLREIRRIEVAYIFAAQLFHGRELYYINFLTV